MSHRSLIDTDKDILIVPFTEHVPDNILRHFATII